MPIAMARMSTRNSFAGYRGGWHCWNPVDWEAAERPCGACALLAVHNHFGSAMQRRYSVPAPSPGTRTALPSTVSTTWSSTILRKLMSSPASVSRRS